MADRAVIISEKDWTRFEFDVVSEEVVEISSEITEHPIEQGGNVSDHVEHRPNMLTIEGVVIDPEDRILRKMLRWKNEAHRLIFRGENVLGNLVIQEHRRNHDVSVADGWRFHTTLQQVETARPEIREIVKEDPATEGTPASPPPADGGTATEASEKKAFDRQRFDYTGHPALGIDDEFDEQTIEEAVFVEEELYQVDEQTVEEAVFAEDELPDVDSDFPVYDLIEQSANYQEGHPALGRVD